MDFSTEYFKAMEVARGPVMSSATRAFDSAPAREFVPKWYVMLYQIIRATGPVLAHASYELQYGNERKEDFACDLRAYYDAKHSEESDHHESLEADLGRVGVSFDEIQSAPLNPWVAEMVGRQYYLIDFVHPAAYLGFIGLLEGFPPTLAQLDAIQAASGYPPEAFSCARLHAKADVGHRAELAGMLDEVPAHLHAAILENGRRCAGLQCAALDLLSQELPHG